MKLIDIKYELVMNQREQIDEGLMDVVRRAFGSLKRVMKLADYAKKDRAGINLINKKVASIEKMASVRMADVDEIQKVIKKNASTVEAKMKKIEKTLSELKKIADNKDGKYTYSTQMHALDTIGFYEVELMELEAMLKRLNRMLEDGYTVIDEKELLEEGLMDVVRKSITVLGMLASKWNAYAHNRRNRKIIEKIKKKINKLEKGAVKLKDLSELKDLVKMKANSTNEKILKIQKLLKEMDKIVNDTKGKYDESVKEYVRKVIRIYRTELAELHSMYNDLMKMVEDEK